jgi:hypothetical protein
MKKVVYVLASLALLTITSIYAGSPEIEDAINNHRPEKLLKLSSLDLADLIEHKEDYIAKAHQATNKVWHSLQSRLDWRDLFRLLVGAGMMGLGGYLCYTTGRVGLPLLEQWRNERSKDDNIQVSQDAPVSDSQKDSSAIDLTKHEETPGDHTVKPTIDRDVLIGITTLGPSGVLLAFLGLLNIRKGLAKYDRFNRYCKALAVETNLQRWAHVKVAEKPV